MFSSESGYIAQLVFQVNIDAKKSPRVSRRKRKVHIFTLEEVSSIFLSLKHKQQTSVNPGDTAVVTGLDTRVSDDDWSTEEPSTEEACKKIEMFKKEIIERKEKSFSA